jgi:hypothetical protein
MKKDHALIVGGEFVRLVPRPNSGGPIAGLPAGTQILPVVYAEKPAFDELTERLAMDAGSVIGDTFQYGWVKIPIPQEELSDALRRKYPDADTWRVKQWLLEQKGKDRAAVIAELAKKISDPGQLAAATQRYDIVPVTPFNHPLTLILAQAFGIDLAEKWEEIRTYK